MESESSNSEHPDTDAEDPAPEPDASGDGAAADESAPSRPHTPAAHGYHMPAEWAPHQGTWISWPHNEENWEEERLEKAAEALAQVVSELCTGETVHINVDNAPHEQRVRRHLKAAGIEQHIIHSTVRFHSFPTNDAWCRDHGGLFVIREEEGGQKRRAVTDWKFNAWGEKYSPYDLDDAIPIKMARALGAPRFEMDMVLEGGAVDVNGEGLLLAAEQSLLNPNRNPDWSRLEVEEMLREGLGVHKVGWLKGILAGDETDGHINNIVRFVDQQTVLAVREDNTDDVNYAPLEDNHERLQKMTNLKGKSLRVIELPMPAPVFNGDRRLPASYANFYIGNRAVLFPTFGDPNDDRAGSILKRMFPHRQVVPVDCRALLDGCGAIHSMTQQVPAT